MLKLKQGHTVLVEGAAAREAETFVGDETAENSWGSDSKYYRVGVANFYLVNPQNITTSKTFVTPPTKNVCHPIPKIFFMPLSKYFAMS